MKAVDAQPAIGTTYCCSIDLDWIIHKDGARSMACHTLPRRTIAEWVTYAALLKAKGMEVMPTCTHVDKLGWCQGHTPTQKDPQP